MKYFQWLQRLNWLINRTPRASTLVEVAIALTVIIFLAVLSMPLISTLARHTVAAQAYALRTSLWHAQQLAIAADKKISVIFDEVQNSYRYETEIHKLTSSVKFGIVPNVLGPPSSPTKKLVRAVTFENNTAVCYPQGTVSPGSIYLVDEQRQVLYAITVPIAGVSYIRVYRYTQRDGWKVCS